MNEWYLLLWLDAMIALFSVPLLLFIGLMRLVGRVGRRTLAGVVAAEAVLWAFAAVFWWMSPVP